MQKTSEKMRRSLHQLSNCIEPLESRTLLSGYTLSNLGYFTDGGNPRFGVIADSAGNLYGLTQAGGTNKTGSVYEVAAGTNKPLVLASFPAATTGSLYPNSLVVDSNGNLFGSTDRGGTNGTGSIFELIKGAKTLTTLASFDVDDTTNASGAYPEGNIQIDSSGNLFGTAVDGGQVTNGTGGGTYWELKNGAGTITPLAVFPVLNPGSSDPLLPSRANFFTKDSAGDVFGEAEGNQQNGYYGYVWEIPVNSNTVDTLATFNNGNGSDPLGPIAIDGSGNVFGTTIYGGSGVVPNSTAGAGIIWEVKANSGTITDLATFNATVGYSPDGVAIDSKGDLFGTANYGGTATPAEGTAWELPTGSSIVSVLANFGAEGSGQLPVGGLLISSSGNLYGTTFQAGGPQGTGTGNVFELIAPDNAVPSGRTTISSVVTKTTLPAAIIAGSSKPASATVTVSNTGSAVASENATVYVYATTTGVIDANSTLLGTGSKIVRIRSDKTTPVTVTIKSVPKSLSGTYTLLAQTADSYGNTVNATTGPTVTIAAPFVSYADTIVKTTLAPADISGQSTKANLQVKITNNGNILSTGTTTIALYASTDGTATDGTSIRTYTTTAALKPGASKTVTIPLQAIPTVANGNYYLVAQVTDPLLNVSTAKSTGTFTLAAPFASLSPVIVSTTLPATTASGSTSKATITINITNNGNIASAPGSTVSVYASPDGTVGGGTLLLGTLFKTALKPAKSSKVKISLSNFPLLAPGNYFLVVQITGALSSATTTASATKYAVN